MNSTEFVVVPIPTRIAALVRETNLAPGYGHPAHTEVATGYGPCRHCLRTFEVGQERRILFTYNPFHGLEPIPLPGPIFIHAASCERYPSDASYPQDMLQHAAVMNAFRKGQELIARRVVTENGGHNAAVLELLDNHDVDYIEVRDLDAGCFDFRIERRG